MELPLDNKLKNQVKPVKKKNPKTTNPKLYKGGLSGHREAVVGIFSPDGFKGSMLVTISKDGCLRGWDLVGNKKLQKIFLSRDNSVKQDNEDTPKKKAFDPLNTIEAVIFNRLTVFCGFGDGAIYAWNLTSGKLVYNYQGHEDKVTALIWIDPNTFASSSSDQTIVIWDTSVSS